MPIAIAAVEIYEGVAAYTAAATVLETVAAGAMIAGGAMTVVGTATGNKDLTNAGMLVGAAGSLGTAALGTLSTPAVPKLPAAATDASGAATATSGEIYGAPVAMGPAGTPAPVTGLNVSGATPTVAASAPGAGTGLDAATTAKLDAIQSTQLALQKYSLVSGGLQGLATGYSGWAQQQATKETQAQQIAFQQAQANRANTTGAVNGLQAVGALNVGPAPVATPTVGSTAPAPAVLKV